MNVSRAEVIPRGASVEFGCQSNLSNIVQPAVLFNLSLGEDDFMPFPRNLCEKMNVIESNGIRTRLGKFTFGADNHYITRTLRTSEIHMPHPFWT